MSEWAEVVNDGLFVAELIALWLWLDGIAAWLSRYRILTPKWFRRWMRR